MRPNIFGEIFIQREFLKNGFMRFSENEFLNIHTKLY